MQFPFRSFRFGFVTIACFTAAIVVASMTACAPAAKRKLARPQPRDVYLQVADNYRRLRTFSGSGKIVMEMPNLQYAGSVRVAARVPDSLIVRVEAAFGTDVGFFFADRQRFATYTPLENIYYTGHTQEVPALLFFHIEVSFEEIMGAVVGAVVPPYDSTFTMQRDGADYRFDGWRGDWRVSYWVDSEKLVVKRGTLTDASGHIVAKQEFRRFHERRGVWLPQMIRVEQPAPKGQSQGAGRMTIFYERQDTGNAVAPAEFTFKVPASARRVDLSPADSSAQR